MADSELADGVSAAIAGRPGEIHRGDVREHQSRQGRRARFEGVRTLGKEGVDRLEDRRPITVLRELLRLCSVLSIDRFATSARA